MRRLTKLELEAKVAEFSARQLAMRDIVARLLALVAASAPDDEVVFREFSEAGDVRVDNAPVPETEGQLAMTAWFQDETDRIVQAAKIIVSKAKDDNSSN